MGTQLIEYKDHLVFNWSGVLQCISLCSYHIRRGKVAFYCYIIDVVCWREG